MVLHWAQWRMLKRGYRAKFPICNVNTWHACNVTEHLDQVTCKRCLRVLTARRKRETKDEQKVGS